MGSFVYKDGEVILQKTLAELKEKHSIEFEETSFGDKKIYKYCDFSLSFLSSTLYSIHLDKILNINFTDKELYLICPIIIRYGLHLNKTELINFEIIIKSLLKNLNFFEQQKTKHIFFLPGDNKNIFDCMKNSIVFTVSPSMENNALPLYYTSPTVCDKIIDIKECPVDICFHGSLNTHPIRPKAINTLYHIKKYKTSIHCNFEFIEYLDEKEYLRYIYKKSLEECKFVLCPRGRGSNSIRFYEAINFGKIPILISDDVKLPLRSKIDYSEFCIEMQEKNYHKIEQYVDNFLKTHDIQKASLKAKEISQTWFAMDTLDKFVTESVREYNSQKPTKNSLFI